MVKPTARLVSALLELLHLTSPFFPQHHAHKRDCVGLQAVQLSPPCLLLPLSRLALPHACLTYTTPPALICSPPPPQPTFPSSAPWGAPGGSTPSTATTSSTSAHTVCVRAWRRIRGCSRPSNSRRCESCAFPAFAPSVRSCTPLHLPATPPAVAAAAACCACHRLPTPAPFPWRTGRRPAIPILISHPPCLATPTHPPHAAAVPHGRMCARQTLP